LLQFGPQLERVRTEVLAAADGAAASPINWPKRTLNDYRQHRKNSLLGRILTVARRLRETVDRVVVIGSPSLITAAQALLAAGGHPLHNELSRAQRGERPRIHLLPATADNDAVQALFDILPQGRLLHDLDEKWGLVALDTSIDGDIQDDRLLTSLFSLFWDKLQLTSTATDEVKLAAVIGPRPSPLLKFAESLGIDRVELRHAEQFDALPPTASRPPPAARPLQPGVLVAASLIGLDIVNLLIGAAAMSDRFATRAPGENPALDLAGLRYLLAQRREIDRLTIGSPFGALKLLGRLLSRDGRSANELLIQCLPQSVRADRLRVTMPIDSIAAESKKRIARGLPELAEEEANKVRDTRIAAGRPTAVIRLPQVDELSLGQLMQLVLIAEVVESELRVTHAI
jgi:glucose-6-phosphate isomerase